MNYLVGTYLAYLATGIALTVWAPIACTRTGASSSLIALTETQPSPIRSTTS